MENKNSLTSRVIDDLSYRRDRVLNGHINSIPSNFKRFSKDFLGIEQQKMYVVTGGTKSAKTQISSYMFIYTPLLYAFENKDKIRIKIFYYPYEETPEDILIRFICYILYVKSGFKIRKSPTQLKSTVEGDIISQEIIDLLGETEYQEILNFFEENVIFSNSHNPTGVYTEAKKYAEEHGKVYTKKQKVKDDITGCTKEVDVFDYYEQDDPDEYRIIFIDHISLVQCERGMTLKQSIDKLSEYCVVLRNRYKFSPVIVQQQALAQESLDAFKENKLRPTLANLSDSKYCARDANVVLGIFSPFRFELPSYMDYNITLLRDNVRFLEVIINRSGSPGGIVALYFDGATNYFTELPNPKNTVEMSAVYKKVIASREGTQKVISYFTYVKHRIKQIFKKHD